MKKPLKTLIRPCPLCGITNDDAATQIDYAPAEWPMVSCHECGMIYLKKAPDVSELFENLAWEKSAAIEHQRREKEHGAPRKISRLTRKRLHMFPRRKAQDLIVQYASPGKVIDVGCGTGLNVLSLPDQYVPYGIEISKMMSDKCRPNFVERGGEIINMDALSGLQSQPENEFTGIIMRAFLEHDIHPLPILHECARTLKHGGCVVIKVPNYSSLNRIIRGKKWCGLRFPDHVNYFTPKTLTEMVRKSGLRIKQFGLIDRLPTSDNMWMIAVKG